MNSRYQVYKSFTSYKQENDERSMDEICLHKDGEFQLQVQQKFLKDYVTQVKDWKSLLFYHEIGSGKTCTAITVAEAYMETSVSSSTKPRATIILPARLMTNFLDELISPCGFNKYISKEDFITYKTSENAREKARIRRAFMTRIEEKYKILTYDGFTKEMRKGQENIIGYIQKWTKNNIIIIDEVHNVFSTKYDIKIYEKIYQSGTLLHQDRRTKTPIQAKGMNAILMNLIVRYCDPSCRFVYLTATPIFNKLEQLREFVKIMTPEVELPKKNTLRELIELLRGKVSYFPGISKNAYPVVEYKYHNIMLTESQDKVVNELNKKRRDSSDTVDEEIIDNEDAFLVKQRLSELCLLDKNQIDEKNIDENAPKIKMLVENLEKNIGKQVVYTNFIGRSIEIIEKILKIHGWHNILDVEKSLSNEAEWEQYKYKVYEVWSGSTKDDKKTMMKSLMNSPKNLFGKYIKVVLGSPAIKEGISFLQVQDMHIMDPVWNMSSKNQVEGRVIRYCSHAGIDEKRDMPLKRKVTIHYYKMIHKPDGLVQKTADEEIYDEIIPQKYKNVEIGEKALKTVALDYHLFKNTYKNPRSKSPTTPKSGISDIIIGENEDIKNKNVKQKYQCPKKKRPVKGKCPPGYEVKPNRHGIPCCYRIKKVVDPEEKKRRSCPVPRRPVDGECPAGYILRVNKYGIPCCYKIRGDPSLPRAASSYFSNMSSMSSTNGTSSMSSTNGMSSMSSTSSMSNMSSSISAKSVPTLGKVSSSMKRSRGYASI